ncbi:hypothetical protein JW935_03155 [candidate division KSB1 bacterium]|nr:hypothetical protein [candidate division KSB1 bacterium]
MRKNLLITRLAIIISITIIIEMLRLSQAVTGPVVNLALYLSVLLITPLAGMILGFITPIVAVLSGQLVPLLYPMLPFIMVANLLLVVSFYITRKLLKFLDKESPLRSVSNWTALIVSALVKYFWLSLSVNLILPVFLGKQLPHKVTVMMALPQLVTALVGGVFALFFFSIMKRIFPDK